MSKKINEYLKLIIENLNIFAFLKNAPLYKLYSFKKFYKTKPNSPLNFYKINHNTFKPVGTAVGEKSILLKTYPNNPSA